MRTKTLLLGAVGVATFLAIFVYLNNITYKSDAASNTVNVLFAPSEVKSKTHEANSVDLFIKAADPTKKISGFDIVLHSSANTDFTAVNPPVEIGSDSAQFTKIVHDVSSNSAHLSYVSPNSADKLPSAVSLRVLFQGSDDGQGSVELVKEKSQVVGTATNSVFTWGNVSSVTVSYVSCSHKGDGDADCNDKVDLVDFEEWRKEFTGEAHTRHADFENSGNVTVLGFELWRKHFFPGGEQPSITITPPVSITKPACIPVPECMFEGKCPTTLPTPPQGWCPSGTATPSATPATTVTRVPSPSVSPTKKPEDLQARCMWCGTSCQPYNSQVMCPMVMPPENKKCVEVMSYGSVRCQVVDTNRGQN